MQSQKGKTKEEKQIFCSWKLFFWEGFLFSLTLILGIGAGFRINQLLKSTGLSLPSISFWQFIFYFIIGTSLIFLISVSVRFEKEKGIIFKALFILATAWGALIFLSVWMSDILALIFTGMLIWWWFKKSSIISHNLSVILGMAGVGSAVGLGFDPLIVVGLLVIFSIYDWIAVYKTKHMIKIAKEMIKSRAILGLIVPQKISDFMAELKEVKPGGKFLILGGGDVIFPLLFCVSLIPSGILNSLIVAIFAFIGLLFSFWIFASQKIRRPIPALPPIALFSIIGFLITRLI